MAVVVKGKACWSCRSSKVRCDLNTPRCSNCAKSGRSCQYGLRLSWPRVGDSRRSVVFHGSSRGTHHNKDAAPQFLNIGFMDVELYSILSSGAFITDGHRQPWLAPMTPESIPRSLPWINGNVEHFLIAQSERVLSVMLTAVDDKRFRELLISMSFVDDSPSSEAVRQALYALIALYIGAGTSWGATQALKFKIQAISALNRSFQTSLDAQNGLQHIAAGLLLCAFEIRDCSEMVHHWDHYAGGAKQVGKRVYALNQVYKGDSNLILQWLFYHDCLAKFSSRHWIRDTSTVAECFATCGHDDHIRRAVLLSGDSTKIINTLGCSTEVLGLIATICDHLLDENNPHRKSSNHLEELNRLERRLVHAEQYTDQTVDTGFIEKGAETYRLAGLIYLYRAGMRYPSSHPLVRAAVGSGFRIAITDQTCLRAFPLLILGCEARSDEDRLAMLAIFDRKQVCGRIAGITRATRRFIEASWAQDDLSSGEEADYVRKMDAIMSLSSFPPSFA